MDGQLANPLIEDNATWLLSTKSQLDQPIGSAMLIYITHHLQLCPLQIFHCRTV